MLNAENADGACGSSSKYLSWWQVAASMVGGFGARDLTEEELAGKRRQHFTQQFFWRGWKKEEER